MKPEILLVNPPVYDFSAYDFWARPYGLLRIGGWLRDVAGVALFDFMDRGQHHTPEASVRLRRDGAGRGEYLSEPAVRPRVFADIPRNYRRFGLPRRVFLEFISAKRFDFVLVNSAMTYWYEGVKEVIGDIRKEIPSAAIVLGGVYATICPEHAAGLGADLVVRGDNLAPLWALLGVEPRTAQSPLWDAYAAPDAGVMKLSDGCPFKCTYCASGQLNSGFRRRALSSTVSDLQSLKALGVTNIAFYDDALLHDAATQLVPFLESEAAAGITFHTPNVLHSKLISRDTAEAMVRGGFASFFLGYENASDDWHARTGGKATEGDFAAAVGHLKHAGVKSGSITAYVLCGHPAMEAAAVEASLRSVNALGVRAMLSEFSPLPGTPDGEICSRFTDLSEPLNHNKTAFTIRRFGDDAQRLKDLCRTLNGSLSVREG